MQRRTNSWAASGAALWALRRAVCLALWGLLICGVAPSTALAAADKLNITSALAVSGRLDEPIFPAEKAAQKVRLPDDWWSSRPKEDGPVWYRLNFDAPSSSKALQAVFIKRVCSSADVLLNGTVIHSGGSLAEPVTRNCYRPQLISLPPALLLPQGNVLDIKVQGTALEKVSARQRAGGLSEVVVGPHAELSALHSEVHFWNITLLQALTVASSVMGLVALWFGVTNRFEPRLIYLGLVTLAWNLMSARILAEQLPFDNATAELLVCSGYAVVAALAVQFVLSQLPVRSRALEVALAVQCVAVPVSLWLVGPQHLFVGSSAWQVLMEVEVILCMLFFLHRRRRSNAPHFFPAAVAVACLAALVLAEQAGQLQSLYPLRPNIAHFLLPAVLMALAVRQLHEYAKVLQTVESNRLANETRMAEAAAEMERNYAQMAELHVEQVTEKERKRIAGDLHDDLGAKLLTIVHTSESERISSLAREALEEMRLSVKGLTGKPLPVANALADWRAETVLRLGQAGVEAEWRGPTEDLTQQLSARAFVQTTRILREAVSNVIKHSGASHCKVHCSLGENDFVLVVQDNGHGIPMELDGKLDRGHGMASMKHRAKQMQGQCLVESGPGYGTVIRLTLPL